MWIGLILLCGPGMSECLTLNGTIQKTEEACYESIETDGRAYVEMRYPGMSIVATDCYSWGKPV